MNRADMSAARLSWLPLISLIAQHLHTIQELYRCCHWVRTRTLSHHRRQELQSSPLVPFTSRSPQAITLGAFSPDHSMCLPGPSYCAQQFCSSLHRHTISPSHSSFVNHRLCHVVRWQSCSQLYRAFGLSSTTTRDQRRLGPQSLTGAFRPDRTWKTMSPVWKAVISVRSTILRQISHLWILKYKNCLRLYTPYNKRLITTTKFSTNVLSSINWMTQKTAAYGIKSL